MASKKDVDTLTSRLGPGSWNADLQKQLIDAAQAFLEGLVGLEIFSGPQDFTQVSNGNGRDRLILSKGPIISVDSVTVSGRVIPPIPTGDTTSHGWLLNPESGVIYLRGYEYSFSFGVQNVVIPFSYGYDMPPADIWNVCMEMALLKYKRNPKLDLQSVAVAGETTSFSKDDLTPMQKATVANYRRWSWSQ